MPEAWVAAQVPDSVSVGLQESGHLRQGKVGPGLVVFGGVGDEFVGPDCVHDIAHAGPAAPQLALDAQQGVFVGCDADPPSPAVVDSCDLDRVDVLVPGAEWARSRGVGGEGGTARREVARPLWGDDHPASQDGVASQFGRIALERHRTTAGHACSDSARGAPG